MSWPQGGFFRLTLYITSVKRSFCAALQTFLWRGTVSIQLPVQSWSTIKLTVNCHHVLVSANTSSHYIYHLYFQTAINAIHWRPYERCISYKQNGKLCGRQWLPGIQESHLDASPIASSKLGCKHIDRVVKIAIKVSLSLASATLLECRNQYCQYFLKQVSLAVSPIHFQPKSR